MKGRWTIPVLASILILGILFPPQMAFAILCFQDLDNDGFGTGSPFENGQDVCGVDQAPISLDCNDGDPDTNPAGTDDPADDVDENCSGTVVCYQDLDIDGHGSFTFAESTFSATNGFADISGACGSSPVDVWDDIPDDCNDIDATVFTGAPEIIADSIDQNCNGVDSCFFDGDDDSFGIDVVVDDNNLSCTDASALTSDNNLDCDDTNPLVNLICELLVVGGTYLPIDSTALLLAGAQSISMWMLLGVLSLVGIGLAVFTLKRR